LGVIYRSFTRFGHEARVGGASVNLVGCVGRVATTHLVVDAEIVLRVLVVVLGSDPIVTSRRFLSERKVTLIYLEGASPGTLAGTTSVERLVALWPSLRLGWPVWIKAAARPLIGS
jgi:hypothetical protein